jgi:putative phosphoesterase
MKIVVISDVHGNFDALSALPELGDELWVLGDLVNYGPTPAEVVGFVRAHSEVVIRGNHDHAVGFDVDPRCTPRYAEMADTTMQYSKSCLDGEALAYLHDLPLTRVLERDGRKFFLCHAIPSNPLYGYCPADSELWSAELEQVDADFLLVGHTHTPFIRKIGGKTIVNPGSLGQPKTGKADACYAVWENRKLELKQFAYPVQRAVERIEHLPVPDEIRRDLVKVLRTGSV